MLQGEINGKQYKSVLEKLEKMTDCAEMLWSVIANVSGSDWTQQNEEWQTAAKKWRDVYFDLIKK